MIWKCLQTLDIQVLFLILPLTVRAEDCQSFESYFSPFTNKLRHFFLSLKVSQRQMLVTLGSLKYIFETEFNYIGKVSALTRELYLLVPIRLPPRQSFLNKIEDICCSVEWGVVEWCVVSPHRVVTSNASTVPTQPPFLISADWLWIVLI